MFSEGGSKMLTLTYDAESKNGDRPNSLCPVRDGGRFKSKQHTIRRSQKNRPI